MNLNPREVKNLPPMFGRSRVSELFPGIISEKTLANLASRGEGPRYFKRDRQVYYITTDFLDWLKAGSKAISTRDQHHEAEERHL